MARALDSFTRHSPGLRSVRTDRSRAFFNFVPYAWGQPAAGGVFGFTPSAQFTLPVCSRKHSPTVLSIFPAGIFSLMERTGR